MNSAGWVGIDLDGCLARYDNWQGPTHIGEPIPEIVNYVKMLHDLRVEVRIFTARVQEGPEAVEAIERWLAKHLGFVLEITDRKDFSMVFCVDDRAITVEANTGKFLVEPPSLDVIAAHWNNPMAPPMEFKRDSAV